MVKTMGDSHGWSDQSKDSKALLCMLGLGGGEILGALAFGRIADKLENKKTIMINMLMSTIAYVFLILYASIYDFTFYMAIFMTFTWGVQDAGMNTYLNALLGFQFASKTTPFSVFKFLQSFLIFCVDELVTTTDNQLSYICFFGATYVVAMASWIIFSVFFDRKTQKEVDQMRKDKIA